MHHESGDEADDRSETESLGLCSSGGDDLSSSCSGSEFLSDHSSVTSSSSIWHPSLDTESHSKEKNSEFNDLSSLEKDEKSKSSELERHEEKKQNNQSQSKDYIDSNKLTKNNEQTRTPQTKLQTRSLVQNGKGLQNKDGNDTAINSGKDRQKKNHINLAVSRQERMPKTKANTTSSTNEPSQVSLTETSHNSRIDVSQYNLNLGKYDFSEYKSLKFKLLTTEDSNDLDNLDKKLLFKLISSSKAIPESTKFQKGLYDDLNKTFSGIIDHNCNWPVQGGLDIVAMASLNSFDKSLSATGGLDG